MFMEMQTIAWIVWTLALASLLLGLGVIPLALRRVSRTAWRIHTATALGIGVAAGVLIHVTIFAGFIPWWFPVVGYLSALGVPPVAAAWSARAASRRWVQHAGWPVVVAACGTYVVALFVGWRTFTMLVPDIVNAVK